MDAKKKLNILSTLSSIFAVLSALCSYGSIDLLFGRLAYGHLSDTFMFIIVLANAILVPALSLVMSAGLKWADKDTLVPCIYCLLGPQILLSTLIILGTIQAQMFAGIELGFVTASALVLAIAYLPIRILTRLGIKYGKAYRQKLLDEIAAEEAVAPPQNS